MLRRSRVAVSEPMHIRSTQQETFRKLLVGLAVLRNIADRVNKQLKTRHAIVVPQFVGRHRRKVAPCTVAADGDALGINVQLVRVGCRPTERIDTIVHAGGPGVLRR